MGSSRRRGSLQNLSGIAVFLFCIVTPISVDAAWIDPPQIPRGLPQANGNQDNETTTPFNMIDESSVFVPAPREILRPLMRAQKAIDKKEFGQAVQFLGDVLSDSTTEDFLVKLPGADGLAISLRNRAQQLLGSISQKDRKLYELRYGVQAKQMLQQAIEAREFDKMSQVMRRFFYTPAGYDAAMLIGHYHLDQGHPIAAAFCFQRVVETESARAIHDPEASVLLAACWMLADWPDRAESTLLELKQRQPNGSISFAGNKVPIFRDGENSIAWLERLMGNSPLSNNRVVQQWLMFGGNAQRNARSGAGFPLFSPEWSVPTLNNPDQERLVREKLSDLIFADATTIPAVHPIAVGDTIVMRSFDKMIGVDFKTGKRVWVFPHWDTESFFDNDMALDQQGRDEINKGPLAQRMLFDSVYGQISSDGKMIFAVPSPGFAQGKYAKLVLQGGALIDHPLSMRTYNEIKAVDVRREGAFRWEVGGQTGLDEPKLAKTFFLGPPLPLDGSLYAICEQDGETRMVVLDPETGKLQWSQQLASTEKGLGKPSRHAYRRLAGATPSFSDGLVICPTGARSIVAVELSTRSLLWGYQYGAPNQRSDPRIMHDKLSGAVLDDGNWKNSAIRIADGCVLYTPIDSHELICLDLLTGKPKWKGTNEVSIRGIPRKDSLFLACVEKNAAILVGVDKVRAISLKSGAEQWSADIGVHGRASGHGYSSEGAYFLPTTAKKLVRIDLATGKITKVVSTNGILGNLICYRGMVVSHGVDHVASFPQDEPNRQLVKSAEARGSLSPAQLAIKAQLQMQEGDIANAVENISKAYDAEPDPGKESILLDLVLRLVQQDFVAGSKYISKFESQLLESRRNEFHAAQIDGRIKNGEVLKAFESILELMKETPDSIASDSAFFRSDSSPGIGQSSKTDNAAQDLIFIRMDRWLRGRIDYIFDQATPEQVSLLLAKVEQFFASVDIPDSIQKHDLMRIFQLHRISPDLRMALAEELAQPMEIQFDQPATLLPPQSLTSPGSNMSTKLRALSIYSSLISSSSDSIWGDKISASLKDTANQQLAASYGKSLTPKMAKSFLEQSNIENASELGHLLDEKINASVRTGADWKRGVVDSDYAPQLSEFGSQKLNRHLLEYSYPINGTLEEFQFRIVWTTGLVEITNSIGEPVARFRARPLAQNSNVAITVYHRGIVKFSDNILLVSIANELFAVDWLSINEDGLNPVIWAKRVEQQSVLGAATPARPSIWGDYAISSYYRTRYQTVASTNPSIHGICYIEQTNLVCVDPFTGQVLWKRPNVMPRSKLLGGQNQVVVWNMARRSAQIIDLANGNLINEFKLDRQLGSVWYETDSGILLSNVQTIAIQPDADNDQSKPTNAKSKKKPLVKNIPQLAYFDLFSGKIVWSREFPATTRAVTTDNQVVAVLPPEGNFELIDIQTGDTIHELPLNLPISERGSEQKNVRSIDVDITRDSYILKIHTSAINSTRVTSRSGQHIFRAIFSNQKFWNGYLVSIDRKTGGARWKKPVRMENFQISRNQPFDCPFIFLARRVDLRTGISSQRYWLQVIAIDARTGEVAAREKTPNDYYYDFRIQVHPQRNQVTLGLQNRQFEFVSTDEPPPPRPVAYLTDMTSAMFSQPTSSSSYKPDRNEIEAERQELIKQLIDAQKRGELQRRQAEMKKRLEQQRKQPVDPKKAPDK